MLDACFSHLYFYQSLNRLQRGLSAIAELLVLWSDDRKCAICAVLAASSTFLFTGINSVCNKFLFENRNIAVSFCERRMERQQSMRF